MKIYNAGRLDRNSRFILSIFAGLAAAIVLGILYGLFTRLARVELSILFVGIGWCIAQVLRYTGHGVTQKYAVLGAVLTAIAIFIGDSCATYGINALFQPSYYPLFFSTWLARHLSASLSAILGILFRIYGIAYAYQYSRIF